MKFGSITDYFYEELLPFAIEIGMQSKEFWEEDPRLMNSYIKAYEKSLETKNKFNDTNAWLIGSYVYDALISLESAKNGKTVKYPSKPMTYLEEERKQNPVAKQYFAFKAWADSFNEKRKG